MVLLLPATGRAEKAVVSQQKASTTVPEILQALYVPWRLKSIHIDASVLDELKKYPDRKPKRPKHKPNPRVVVGELLFQLLPQLRVPPSNPERPSEDAPQDGWDRPLEMRGVLVADEFTSPVWSALNERPPKPKTDVVFLDVNFRQSHDPDRRAQLDFHDGISIAWPSGSNVGDGVMTIETLTDRRLVLTKNLNVWAVRDVVSVPFTTVEFEAVPGKREGIEQSLKRRCDRGQPEGCLRLGSLRAESNVPARRKQAEGYFLSACRLGDVAGGLLR